MATLKRITDKIQMGDFSEFNMLAETQQIEIMKTWDRDTWIAYRMQNTVSEQEVFDPIFKLLESDD